MAGGSGESVVRLGEQAGDVSIGTAAQTVTTYNHLADLPPGLAQWAADQHEASLRMIDALERMQTRMDTAVKRVRDDLELYRVLDESDRRARRQEIDRRGWVVWAWLAGLTVAVALIGYFGWQVVWGAALTLIGVAVARMGR